MKEIALSKGFFTLVDDENFDDLINYKWHVSIGKRTAYAYRSSKSDVGKRIRIPMPNHILDIIGNGLMVDHIDHNGLNNQKSNLRICTHQQNMMNQQKHIDSPNKYKGVTRKRHSGMWLWEARIMINGKTIRHYFNTEREAALKRDRMTIEHFGDWSDLNILKKVTKS